MTLHVLTFRPLSRTCVVGVIALSGWALSAQAQVFKCEVAGKIAYQQQPCEGLGATKQRAAAQPKPAASPNLWTQLSQGMSVAEVQRQVPEAKPGDRDQLRNGALALLQVPSVSVAGLGFQAQFFFLDDKFHRVNFSGPMANGNAANLQAFEKLHDIFRGRYGVPVVKEVKDSAKGLSGRADWKIDAGDVWMILVPVGANTSLFNFGYLPKSSRP